MVKLNIHAKKFSVYLGERDGCCFTSFSNQVKELLQHYIAYRRQLNNLAKSNRPLIG